MVIVKSGWCESMVKMSLPTHNIEFDTILELGSMTKLQNLWWYGKHRYTFDEGSGFKITDFLKLYLSEKLQN